MTTPFTTAERIRTALKLAAIAAVLFSLGSSWYVIHKLFEGMT